MVAAVALALTACGATGGTASVDPPSEPAVADFVATAVGRTYVSTDVTVKSEPRRLVEGSRLRLTFDETNVRADAGCNSLGGAYRLDGERLVVSALGGTEIGCEPALMRQDKWLAGLLTAGPMVALEGDRLTLTDGDTVVTMVDVESAEPDRPLRGTRWMLESYAGSQPDDTVSSVPAGVTSTLEITRRPGPYIRYGCKDGEPHVEIFMDALRVRRLPMTAVACGSYDAEVERALTDVLSADPAWRIDGDVLTLTSRAGTLTYRAER